MEMTYIVAWVLSFSLIAGAHYILVKKILRERYFDLYQKGILRMPDKINFVIIYLLSLVGFLAMLLIAFAAYIQIYSIPAYWGGIVMGFFIALIQTAVWLSVNIPWSLVWMISILEFVSFSLAGFLVAVII